MTLNYLHCDVLGHMDSTVLSALLSGEAGGMRITPAFLFGAGVLMEIPIAMVLLSRFLPPRPNRWANIVAGSVTTLVQLASLTKGATAYYAFYSVVEIGCTAFIVWYAVSKSPERVSEPACESDTSSPVRNTPRPS